MNSPCLLKYREEACQRLWLSEYTPCARAHCLCHWSCSRLHTSHAQARDHLLHSISGQDAPWRPVNQSSRSNMQRCASSTLSAQQHIAHESVREIPKTKTHHQIPHSIQKAAEDALQKADSPDSSVGGHARVPRLHEKACRQTSLALTNAASRREKLAYVSKFAGLRASERNPEPPAPHKSCKRDGFPSS